MHSQQRTPKQLRRQSQHIQSRRFAAITNIGEENSVLTSQYPKSPHSVASFINKETRRKFV